MYTHKHMYTHVYVYTHTQVSQFTDNHFIQVIWTTVCNNGEIVGKEENVFIQISSSNLQRKETSLPKNYEYHTICIDPDISYLNYQIVFRTSEVVNNRFFNYSQIRSPHMFIRYTLHNIKRSCKNVLLVTQNCKQLGQLYQIKESCTLLQEKSHLKNSGSFSSLEIYFVYA